MYKDMYKYPINQIYFCFYFFKIGGNYFYPYPKLPSTLTGNDNGNWLPCYSSCAFGS